jgi:TRAP-type mannitol/chloroaromatic compound transport system permease small subunit
MKFLRLYIQFINQLNEGLGRLTAWLTTGLVLVVCVDVLRRYLFKATSVAVIELEWYLFSIIFLLAAGYSLKHDQHVRVDVFYTRMTLKGKAWVNFGGTLLFLIPFCVVVIYTSYKFAWVSWQMNESSPNPGGLPATYFIKAMIPIGFVFLLLQALALLFASSLVILDQKDEIFEPHKPDESHV